MGAIAWFWLDLINDNMTALHRKTVFASSHSLYLIKEITELSSSAPYIFNLNTRYKVEYEGNLLSKNIENINTLWNEWLEDVKDIPEVDGPSQILINSLTEMDRSIKAFMLNLDSLFENNEKLFINTQKLNFFISSSPSNNNLTLKEASTAKELHNILLLAAHSGNLLSLGEFQRKFVHKLSNLKINSSSLELLTLVENLEFLALGPQGIFLLREHVLENRLSARSKLFNIQMLAREVNFEILSIAKSIENLVSHRRLITSEKIEQAQYVILLVFIICILITIATTTYVLRYVLRNLNEVTESMLSLAHGESDTKISVGSLNNDEISDLVSAFDVFRSNAQEIETLLHETKEKSALIQNTFAGMNDGVLVTDSEQKVILWNSQFLTLLEIDPGSVEQNTSLLDLIKSSPIIQNKNFDSLHDFDRHNQLEFSKSGISIEIRKYSAQDGGNFWFASDVTDNRQVQNRIKYLEHLEKLGQIAGSVAHDFNNILAAIIGNLEILVKNHTADKESTVLHQRIQNAAEIGTSLTQRLLAFAKKQHLRPEPVEINELVLGLIDLLDFSTGKNVNLKFNAHYSPLIIKIDAGQFEHAILNICLNSAQAIADTGEILITIEPFEHDSCCIKVTDTGCGIEPDILDRVFEPFFTRRLNGQGTGLGLSMVFGFIKQSGGSIKISSKVGSGTSIEMYLPLYQETQQKDLPAFAETESSHSTPVLKGPVLIVEDDNNLRFATEKMFLSLNLEVYSAATAGEALDYIDKGLVFDLLFTDVVLEGPKDGWILASEVLQKLPGITIIVTSSLAQEDQIPQDLPNRISFLPKPYNQMDIKNLIF